MVKRTMLGEKKKWLNPIHVSELGMLQRKALKTSGAFLSTQILTHLILLQNLQISQGSNGQNYTVMSPGTGTTTENWQ